MASATFEMNAWFGGIVLFVGILYVLHDLGLFFMKVDILHLSVFLAGLGILYSSVYKQKDIKIA